MKEINYWNEKIEDMVKNYGLDCYPQEFEICSYEEMLSWEAYLGMPARYPHWSFGKAYERKKTFYRYNLAGLPYELVINSNPCLAYLMKDNTLLLQILTMAHVYGHNDFFKNNRLFREGTRAEFTIEMFKSNARRIREYVSDPSIGYTRVERILDVAHALRLQITRTVGEKILSEEEKRQKQIDKIYPVKGTNPLLEPKKPKPEIDMNKLPIEPEEDLLLFLINYADLDEWEKDIIRIVREESLYFLPQIETKIMNEGWASYWHYKILKNLDLPESLYIEFLKRHNQVIRTFEGGLNPYHIGFKIFEYIDNNSLAQNEIFNIRETERDSSFIRRYLNRELCEELKLFEYRKRSRDYIITEVADNEGWKEIRDNLATNVGIQAVPNIKVIDVNKKDNILLLEHEWDGRELQLEFAHETLKYIARLWGGNVRLKTIVRASYQILESDGT
ncbi:SpoVR-like protein [Candidatus Syntrophocurvum alkaliphilum]|uniref:SpoVR-like protein n=1 Tax=Candidatus Syntrophocurvum alkaliphilum TaxID=2293317 RepID=A0A6I6DEI7_9FIRM|nr:SpoVR family protein [Candidatus Syntrophocurvum alkaliphilum]QGU00862.1 SpoVR-like protein [Candidatus Syntrophocurvum alkaliphilum]